LNASLHIAQLDSADRHDWEILARGYKAFYNTPTSDAQFDATWHRLIGPDAAVCGLGARYEGQLVGIAHYVFHTTVWAPVSCYLQDLFTLPSARGKGVARALIDAVAADARQHAAERYYWNTQTTNETARALYDKVAQFKGFIRYDYAL